MSKDPMKLARRLRERMDELGMDQADLADAVGVQQSTISNILTGRTQDSRKLPKIANALSVNLDWLLGGTTHKIDMLDENDELIDDAEYRRRLKLAQAAGGDEEGALQDLGLVAVKEVDLALGLGGGYIDEGAVLETTRYFPASWLRELTRTPPEHLVFARTKGNSMKPTLSDGDIVIIDLTEKRIREQDGVYAIAVAQLGMVKRIWANPDGSYKIKSDNPSVGPETAHDDEMFVLGLVVGKVGKL